MENMSDTKNERVQQRECNSLIMSDINDDIIDVSSIDFSDQDTWLQPPSLDVADNKIRDLVRDNVEQDCNDAHDYRSSIDTRTFTRPKKRSGRLSFESIVESPPPQSPNVWNRVSPGTRKNDEDEVESTGNEKDSIPHMLKSSIPGSSSLCSMSSPPTTTGQESLEAFINMSRSKGIDSFIDLAEPEFSDAIMDMSQPSVLYSSVMSATIDDLSEMTSGGRSLTLSQSNPSSRHSVIEDSQILTESMMQMSMFGDVVDVNFNDTFTKNSANVTVLENTNYCETMDATYLATSVKKTKETMNGTFDIVTLSREKIRSMNATYDTPSSFNETLTNDPHASYIVNRSPCPDSNAKQSIVNDASYIVTPEIFNKTSFLAKNDIPKDASFIITSESRDKPENTTFRLDDSSVRQQNDTFEVKNLDATFEKTPINLSSEKSSLSLANELESTITRENTSDESREASSIAEKIVNNAETKNAEPTSSQGETYENIRAKFSKPATKLQSKLNPPRPLSKLAKPPRVIQRNDTSKSNNLDATFDKSTEKSAESSESKDTTDEHAINETFKAPTCQRVPVSVKQKSADPASHGGGGGSLDNLDATFDNPAPKVRPQLNPPRPLSKLANAPGVIQRNDTFKMNNLDAKFDESREKSAESSESKDTSDEHAINETFKAPTCQRVPVSVKQRSVDPASHGGGSLDNLDSTFDKPAPKVRPQLNPPRPLSRLPQSFQKSNPNLGSSIALTYRSTKVRSAIPSFGFNRTTARPGAARNVESLQLASKLLALGKMKSGSEQRLDVTRNVSELRITGNGSSTESIDSTQSAHSAPDFDDRLSVRSDGSNASYSMRTMNIEEFQKIVRMREECLQESTPKPGRCVLENNWVASSNDLPSPILKNGPEAYGSRGSSPRSTDSTVKTSSPFLSPTESLQNLPIDEIESNKNNVEGSKIMIPRNESVDPKKISQASVKPPRNAGDHRTGLRPPASWTSTNNRPVSGIPRPASRIPGPRFVRPITKINQGDTKK